MHKMQGHPRVALFDSTGQSDGKGRAVSYYLSKERRKVRRMAENADAIGIEGFSQRCKFCEKSARF
jgi:hypothetical protein